MNEYEYIPDWKDDVKEKLNDYRKYRQQVERTALKELKDTYLPRGHQGLIHVRPRQHIPLTNEWVTEIERNEQMPPDARDFKRYRRIVPTFYTWDEYRIYLHVIRTHADYATVLDTVIKNSPNSQDGVIVLAVFEGTDHLTPFTADHLNIEENMFLVCVPDNFSLKIHSESTFIPPFNISMSPLETVTNLKDSIYRRKGFPKVRFDVVFDGKCMVDEERLLHYDLRNKSDVELILQTGIRRQIKVFTFWQRAYYIEVDITSTAKQLITMVIKKCATENIGAFVIQENYINPRHLVLTNSSGKTIDYNNCIERYLEEDNSNHLILSERSSPTDEILIEVIGLESGPEMIKVINGGKYCSAYLLLHGSTEIPINRMVLMGRNKTLNPYDVVNVGQDGSTIRIKTFMRKDDEKENKFTVNVILPNFTILPVYIKVTSTVEDIKQAIEDVGFPNCKQYSILYRNSELREDTILYRINMKNQEYVHLMLVRYSITVISPRDEKTEVKLHAKSAVDNVIKIGDESFPFPLRRTKYLFCGKEIRKGELAEAIGLLAGNRVYQEITETQIILELDMTDRQPIQLSLSRNSIGFRYREQVAKFNLPRHVVDAVEQLLIWRITRPSPTEVVTHKGSSVDDAYYASDLQMTHLSSLPHDPSTGLPQKRTGLTQKAILDECATKVTFTQVKLPPLVLHARPKLINYDTREGMSTLLHRH